MRLFIKELTLEVFLPESGEILNRSSDIVSGMLFLSIMVPAHESIFFLGVRECCFLKYTVRPFQKSTHGSPLMGNTILALLYARKRFSRSPVSPEAYFLKGAPCIYVASLRNYLGDTCCLLLF